MVVFYSLFKKCAGMKNKNIVTSIGIFSDSATMNNFLMNVIRMNNVSCE